MDLLGRTCQRDQQQCFILEAGWGECHLCESIRQILTSDYEIYLNVTTKRVAGRSCIDTHIFSLINQERRWRTAASVYFKQESKHCLEERLMSAHLYRPAHKLIHQRVPAGWWQKKRKKWGTNSEEHCFILGRIKHLWSSFIMAS